MGQFFRGEHFSFFFSGREIFQFLFWKGGEIVWHFFCRRVSIVLVECFLGVRDFYKIMGRF